MYHIVGLSHMITYNACSRLVEGPRRPPRGRLGRSPLPPPPHLLPPPRRRAAARASRRKPRGPRGRRRRGSFPFSSPDGRDRCGRRSVPSRAAGDGRRRRQRGRIRGSRDRIRGSCSRIWCLPAGGRRVLPARGATRGCSRRPSPRSCGGSEAWDTTWCALADASLRPGRSTTGIPGSPCRCAGAHQQRRLAWCCLVGGGRCGWRTGWHGVGLHDGAPRKGHGGD
jgi:hypothetical protein